MLTIKQLSQRELRHVAEEVAELRKLYIADNNALGLSAPEAAEQVEWREPTDSVDVAVLVSSESKDTRGLHYPAIDIDVPCHLVPSATPGHFHLYIDRAVSWEDYCAILLALTRTNIVSEYYYDQTLRRGASFVRKPGVLKPEEPEIKLESTE